MYELAELYNQAGMEQLCVMTCDKIMLMFGLGKYVDKAMELKLQYAPLNKYQMDLVENKESDKVLLKDLATRSKNEDINNFVQVYATCRSMGGDLEKIIGHTSEILSDKMAIEREIKVITAQKKTEGRIISMMPLAMLLMMNIFSYSYIEPLYRTAGGRIIMTGALAGVACGMYLMEKLSEIEV